MDPLKKPSLKDILLKDTATAKVPETNTEICPPGKFLGKLIGFTEEDAYNYVTFEINKKRYNFFYNYFIKDTQDLDANLINWIKALATQAVTDQTSLLEITNTAIGNSYNIEVYNYKSKSGKNAGKDQHAIQFRTLPVVQTVNVQTEELELPF